MNTSPTDHELLDDHELLEAAYAAHMPGQNYIRLVNDAGRDYWNPLEDDGDAFRLMVKLDLSSLVIWNHESGGKRREWWSPNSGHDGGKSATTEADYATDPYAATRLAIVRAAAKIGKEMK
jgi:hypothetical protein